MTLDLQNYRSVNPEPTLTAGIRYLILNNIIHLTELKWSDKNKINTKLTWAE